MLLILLGFRSAESRAIQSKCPRGGGKTVYKERVEEAFFKNLNKQHGSTHRVPESELNGLEKSQRIARLILDTLPCHTNPQPQQYHPEHPLRFGCLSFAALIKTTHEILCRKRGRWGGNKRGPSRIEPLFFLLRNLHVVELLSNVPPDFFHQFKLLSDA